MLVFYKGNVILPFDYSHSESLQRDIKDKADVLHVAASKVLEDGDEVEELVVMRVGEPTADGDGVLGVENVRCGRVVDDDGVLEVAADLGEILDVVALVVIAAFAE